MNWRPRICWCVARVKARLSPRTLIRGLFSGFCGWCQTLRAGQEVAKALSIPYGDPVIQLRRILRLDSKPMVVDEIYLPADLFPDLTLDQLKASDRSLYTLFESLFGVRMVRAEEKIRAVAADPVAAQLLDLEVGTPLLSVERTAFTYGDRAAEWRRGLYSTVNHHYFNELG
jgi:GntR family transcriptional regulator